MDLTEVLGMELNLALAHLQSQEIMAKVKYTSPLLQPTRRHAARVVRITMVGRTAMLIAAYQTSGKACTALQHPN